MTDSAYDAAKGNHLAEYVGDLLTSAEVAQIIRVSHATVQARLGHARVSETLDTYSHSWPDSDERTRGAVDLVLGTAADYLRTSEEDGRQKPRSGA